MKLAKFVVNPLQVNMVVAWDEDTLDAVVIDAAMADAQECDKLIEFINKEKLNVRHILYTHLHYDHCFGNECICDFTGLKPECTAEEEELHNTSDNELRSWFDEQKDIKLGTILKDGDKIQVGKEVLQVILVPGHSPMGVAYYAADSEFLVCGDVLFKGGIGRTDLPGGHFSTLIKALKEKLLSLPDDTLVIPGHGPLTSIGDERRTNPYILSY